MVLGFAEDFTSEVTLDSELLATPSSGMYFNSGVHQSITIDNLLQFLPNLSITPTAYNAGTTYNSFETSRKKSDIVTYNGLIYQSLIDSNTGNQPDISPTQWLLTNIESLRLKAFIFKVKDRLLSELKLNKRLVDNQYLYTVADTIEDNASSLSGDFNGWAFEPKGSDYVAIKINSACLQAPAAAPVTISIVNQGLVVDTFNLTPSEQVSFTAVNKTLFGKGRWILAFPSQSVYTNSGFIDPLQFDGFVSYTVTGIGASVNTSNYTNSTSANGLNFNITAYLDATEYVSDNLEYYGKFYQATFELCALEMFLRNANTRSNREQRTQMNSNLLEVETLDSERMTVAQMWKREREAARRQLSKTFDRNLYDDNDSEFEITIDTI